MGWDGMGWDGVRGKQMRKNRVDAVKLTERAAFFGEGDPFRSRMLSWRLFLLGGLLCLKNGLTGLEGTCVTLSSESLKIFCSSKSSFS